MHNPRKPFSHPLSCTVPGLTAYTHRVGELRLRLPQPLPPFTGTVNATGFGNQCIQHLLSLPSDAPPELLRDVALMVPLFYPNPDVPQDEDCE